MGVFVAKLHRRLSAPSLSDDVAVANRAEILRLAARLADPARREAAAHALAAIFGGSDFLVFIRDDEVDALLPAPGFQQTLSNGSAWRAFLAACIREGKHVDALPLHAPEELISVVGFSTDPDVVIVLLGTSEPASDPFELTLILPLIAAGLRGERLVTTANINAHLAAEAAERAAMLSVALEQARDGLQTALFQAKEAHDELDQVNEQLEHQAKKMEVQADALHRSNTELRKLRAAADSANQAKSDFLATMSHELRTPLNAISGYVQLLDMEIHGPVTEAQRGALQRIETSVRRLLRLISEILNLARIEAGHEDYEITDVPLADVMRHLTPMIEPQIAAKGLHYHVILPEKPPVLRADPEKLEQILLNLLSNAVKFTPAGGSITVDVATVDVAADTAFIRVIDTGIGIPADKVGVIFEPFVQVPGSRSAAKAPGLG